MTKVPDTGAKRAPRAAVTTTNSRSFAVHDVPVVRIRPEDGLGRKRDRDAHRELQQSIARFGVLTPITVRLAPDEKDYVLIVGGEDHKSGQADDCEKRFVKLENWIRNHFPFVTEVTDRWSGQVMEPVDGVAYIGRNPGDKNVYVVTGDSGNGMTHGTVAGIFAVSVTRASITRIR